MAAGDGGPPPPLTLEQTAEILAVVRDPVQADRLILVGGQAVALWGAQLESRTGHAPVTSRDIDFQGGSDTVREVAELLGGRARVADPFDDHGPNTGVAVFADLSGQERVIDFLQAPYGMNADDVAQHAIQVDIDLPDGTTLGLAVMHPRHCMESRVHNSRLASKQTPLAHEQLRASIRQAAAFTGLLLDEGHTRDALKLNEKHFAFAHQNARARRLAITHDIDTFAAVIDDPRMPEAYRTRRWPQMQQLIAERRRNDMQALASRTPSPPARPTDQPGARELGDVTAPPGRDPSARDVRGDDPTIGRLGPGFDDHPLGPGFDAGPLGPDLGPGLDGPPDWGPVIDR